MFETLHSPLAFLRDVRGKIPHEEDLRAYEAWWHSEGRAISGF